MTIDLRARGLGNFPAAFLPGPGIAVDANGLAVEVGLDYRSLASYAEAPGSEFLLALQDPVTGALRQVPASVLLGALTETIDDLVLPKLDRLRANVEDWRGTGGDSSDTGTITAALNAINTAGAGLVLEFEDQTYTLEALLPSLLTSRVLLQGRGQATRLLQQGSFTGMGQFFQFGDASTTVSGCGVRDFWLSVGAAPPSASIWAVYFANANLCTADDLFVTGAAGLALFGSATTRAARCAARRWRGNFDNGATSTDGIFRVVRATALLVSDVFVSSQVNGAKTGALFRVVPPVKIADDPLGDSLVDTLWVHHVSMQSWQEASSLFGKQFGVVLDRRQAPITNVWFDNCVFDHTQETAFDFIAGPSSGGAVDGDIYTRHLLVTNSRFATDGGRGIYVRMPSGGGILRGVSFVKNLVQIEDNSVAFELSAAGSYADVSLIGNNLNETGGTTKTKAAVFKGLGWLCMGNTVCSASGTTTNWTTAFSIEDAATNQFTLVGNQVMAPAIHVSEPDYTTPGTLYRYIRKPTSRRTVRVSSVYAVPAAAISTIPGLSMQLQPGVAYRIRAEILWISSDTAIGAAFVFDGPTIGTFSASWRTPLDGHANAAPFYNHRRTLGTGAASSGVDLANETMMSIGEGIIIAAAGSTAALVVRAVPESASGAITVRVGSTLTVEEVS